MRHVRTPCAMRSLHKRNGSTGSRQVAVPPVYCNLTGKFGLSTLDPSWETLQQPRASVGLSFVIDGLCQADLPDLKVFPDEEGFHVHMDYGDGDVYELQDSDVVCFRGAPPDADGYHSLIPITSFGSHALPPLATVTSAAGRVGGVRSARAAAAAHGESHIQVGPTVRRQSRPRRVRRQRAHGTSALLTSPSADFTAWGRERRTEGLSQRPQRHSASRRLSETESDETGWSVETGFGGSNNIRKMPRKCARVTRCGTLRGAYSITYKQWRKLA